MSKSSATPIARRHTSRPDLSQAVSQTSPHLNRTHASTLTQLARVAEEIGDAEIVRDARNLAARITEGRFFLAIVGQFKRGKSTLLNALIGESLLPTGVTPVTTAITVVRYGAERSAEVVFKDGRRVPIQVDQVKGFVTETSNPENRHEVAAVEIYCPTSLLASGMCIVDTPGLGSIFQENTEETRAFVPHIDAAIVVLGADPPISAEELALVAEVADQADYLVFVLNKADRVTAEDLAEARRFTTDVLARRLHRPEERLFEVSATERLRQGPTREWLAFETRLRELATHQRAVVDQSARRGVARLAARLTREIDEHRDALVRPIEQSERRIAELDRSLRHAEQLLHDLTALLANEERRIISQFFDRVQAIYVSSSASELETEIRRTVTSLASTHRRSLLRHAAFASARTIVLTRIQAWLLDVEPEAESFYRRAAARFISQANEFLRLLTASGDPSFEHLPRSLEPDAGFRGPRHFYFTDLMRLTAVGPLDWVLDRLRGGSGATTAITQDVAAYAARLLASNSSRVVFDLRDRLTESRRALSRRSGSSSASSEPPPSRRRKWLVSYGTKARRPLSAHLNGSKSSVRCCTACRTMRTGGSDMSQSSSSSLT